LWSVVRMIADLKPYAAYKDSGSNWLAQVPTHWEVRALRTLIRPRNERNRIDLPLLSVAREKGVFVRSMTDAGENHNVIPLDLSNYKVARAGALVINKMKAWQGSMGIAPCDGIVSPAYYVYDFDIANGKFGQALLRSKPYVAHFGQASDGVRVGQWDLTIAAMRQIPVLVPPPEEQAAIVRFLDWANARLERTIRAKRRVIGLLTEQKQAIIHRAVTRGLDPAAPLKPSGIWWLGDMPAHWEVTALRRYWRVTDCKHLTVPFVDSGIPLASVVEVQPFSLNLNGCKQTTPEWYRLLIQGDRKPKRGDLIYCRNASVGACALVETDIDFAMGQDVCLIRTQSQNQRFLNYLLHSPFMANQLALILVGSTFKRINISDIKALAVLVPPKSEQDAICGVLDLELTTFDDAIRRVHREIELLREYRNRLVADVVTGKLDVRAAAAALPQEELPSAIEPDALDADDDLDALDESESDNEETAA
jgi:type I restriction enzyme S subunit